MTYFDPFGTTRRLQRQLNDLFGRGTSDPWATTAQDFPAINIFSVGDSYLVRAEAPGMRMEDIDVSVTGDMLTLRGQRQPEDQVAPENWHRQERGYGAFVRTVQLPERVQSDKAEARYANGVLEIRIPKSPETQPRRVAIQTS